MSSAITQKTTHGCNKGSTKTPVAVTSTSAAPTKELSNSEKLTSSVYGVHNPPQDWADVALLIPHEAIRRELTAMCRSVDQLVYLFVNDEDTRETHKALHEGWRAVYFCEWFVGPFTDMIYDHHDNEEIIYFPWIKTRVDLSHWDAEKLSHGHEDLMEMMARAADLCKEIIAKKGENCANELSQLQVQLRELKDFMDEHLAEEERDITPLLRAHFTQKENDEIVQEILKRGGVQSMRNLLPSILVAMQQWGSLDFFEEFWGSIPGPVRHLATNYFIPDYENCIAAKRDAPFWEATAKNRHQQRPPLKRTKCCKISFCFPCII
ncbi:Hemerythrin HHE cation binding domain [Fragilaria crotonensis]|nr:Hemerythrin HHE cation binding domain [Fragilaria crotonensis]